jgi:hypothetical protein
MVKLHLYTTADGCKGILNDGCINRSADTTRDAVLGRGVYLTSLPPTTRDWELIKNDWDGNLWAMLDKLDKADYYIVFGSEDLPDVMKAPGKRNIWMVTYDIYLDEVPCKIGVRGNNVQLARHYGYL